MEQIEIRMSAEIMTRLIRYRLDAAVLGAMEARPTIPWVVVFYDLGFEGLWTNYIMGLN